MTRMSLESFASSHLCQVKEGDNTASAPWAVQWESKAKWEARLQVDVHLIPPTSVAISRGET